MAWILRLANTGVEGQGPHTDVMETHRLDGIGNIGNLGLTLAEAKRLLELAILVGTAVSTAWTPGE